MRLRSPAWLLILFGCTFNPAGAPATGPMPSGGDAAILIDGNQNIDGTPFDAAPPMPTDGRPPDAPPPDALPPDAPPPDAAPPAAGYCDATQLGLVACYRFEVPGIHDDSPAHNDGTAMNVGSVPGVSGMALAVDGNSSVHVPDSPSLDVPSQITMELWI